MQGDSTNYERLGAAIFAVLVAIVSFVIRRVRKSRRTDARFTGLGKEWPCHSVDGQIGVIAESKSKRIRLLPGSKLLPQKTADKGRLNRHRVPLLRTTDDLIRWLGIDLRSLLALANPTDRVRPGRSNYTEWAVPKRRWGFRVICSPKSRLKNVQRRIKSDILDKIENHDAAHGFVKGRSIVTNARFHVQKSLVVKLDLRDFFGHVQFRKIRGVFRHMGYGTEVAQWLALLSSHRPITGQAHKNWNRPGHHLHRPYRHAVQGAPTSPGLANLACLRLDRRLAGLAEKFQATYTRYADDLTFSGDEAFKRGIKRFRLLVRRIIHAEDFEVQYSKWRFMRLGHRQTVTGVVVNRKINVARSEYDRLKAIIHNAGKTGLDAQNRDKKPDFRAYLLGRAAHVSQLNPARGEKLRSAILQLH